MAEWKCSNCGYAFSGDIPPDVCPSCHENCEFVDASCYIPQCGETGRDTRI